MTQSSPQIWVTGADGLLGRAVCDALRARGHGIVPVVRRVGGTTPESEAPLAWDLTTPPDVAALAARPPAAIAHLAADRPLSFGASDVQAVAERNLAMDRVILGLAAERGVPVVYASGCSVYGSTSATPLDEDAPCSPLGPYPAEKLAAEAIGAEFDAREKLRFVSLRISAPYGPRQTARTVLRHFIGLALRGEDLAYHGSGRREQDFVHAQDVAEAFVRALEGEARGVFHVASGAPVTMRALAEQIVSLVTGSKTRVVASGQADAQEALTARYSIDRARNAFGWSPRIALADGLRECIAAFRGAP